MPKERHKKMDDLARAEEIAERLRREPYILFLNDCFAKSLRFRSQCRQRGIQAYLVWCALGLTEVKFPLVGEVTIPYFTHFWGEVEGQRFETSRPLGSSGAWGIIPVNIKPIITIRF